MLFPDREMTNLQFFNAAQASLREIEAMLDQLYALPRTFDLTRKITALNLVYADISREAAEALLSSTETLDAAVTLEKTAENNTEVASHIVILTGYINKATGLLGIAAKAIETAKKVPD